MSNRFRDLLRKVGSGPHTSQNLSQEESADAMRMMLLQEATPAQIGAFMIAHRIKRPTGDELAGMLDAYAELGPQLQPIASRWPVTVFGIPYDGRDRTFPLSLVTALILASVGCPVILHGGDRMPTKEGTPLIDLWQHLDIDWSTCSLTHVQRVLESTGIGFVYLPMHFPLAQGLVPYREQIGKRPPLATLELAWAPYAGEAHQVVGFVHPPTEGMVRRAFELRGTHHFTTVKGLEGSCDLPRERTAIIGLASGAGLERLHLHPHEFGFAGKNVGLEATDMAASLMRSVLRNEPSELRQSILWNAGFFLWRCGQANTLTEAIAQVEDLLQQGQPLKKLDEVRAAVASPQLIRQ